MFIIDKLYELILSHVVFMFHINLIAIDEIKHKNENYDEICGKIYIFFEIT